MSNEIETVSVPEVEDDVFRPTPLSVFRELTPDQQREAAYALQLNDHFRLNGALAIIDEIGRELGPILESLQANPMFKMMGFGKRL